MATQWFALAAVPLLLFLHSRQPGAHVWLMVIVEMVEDLTNREALTAGPHEMISPSPLVHLIDADILG